MSYERKENQVLRDGVVVATVLANGEFECTEEGLRFRTPIAKFLHGLAADDDDGDKEKGGNGSGEKNSDPVKLERIATTRQLIDAMQPYTSIKCPEMTRGEGDRTPAVLDWIKSHDEIRRNVIRDHNGR